MEELGEPRPRSAVGSLESAGPILLFLALNRTVGLRWAVVGATAWSIKLIVDRRRRREPLGVAMPVITGALIVRGLIAIIADSEAVYFGLGIGAKFAVALVAFASMALQKPLAHYGALRLLAVTDAVTVHPEWRRTMHAVTAIGGLYYLVSGAVDITLFQRNSVEGFVLWRFLLNWPLSVVALVAACAVAQWRLDRIPGIGSVVDLVEGRLDELMRPKSIHTTKST